MSFIYAILEPMGARPPDVVAVVESALSRLGIGRDSIVVACSGGRDSAVLADIAMGLSRRGRLGAVSLVYVDHGLRGNTAADAAVVEALADEGGAGFRVVPVDVDRSRPSLEDAARRARYQALESAADEVGARWIATAHTAADQAETVLLRILRGTGVAGLAGIPPRRGRIVRPLLAASRSDVEAYRQARDVAAIEDPTNRDPAFARNRVRHFILPQLAEENPRIEEALCRLAAHAAEQRAALELAATEVLSRAAMSDRKLAIAELAGAPPAVTKRALALAASWAHQVEGDDLETPSLEAVHLDALDRLIRRPAAGSVQIDLPGLSAVREYDTLSLWPPGYRHPAPMREVSVRGPEPPYQIRRWHPGDRMRPARLKGHSRKLADLYIDAKVPREARRRALVVVRAADGDIEWAEYLGPAYKSQVQVSLTTTPGVTK
jgi:tRNA(Ile)-lysidine synthase